MFDGAQKVDSNCASAVCASLDAGSAVTPASKVIARQVLVDFNIVTTIRFQQHILKAGFATAGSRAIVPRNGTATRGDR
jgi:hypothetical protein